MNKYGFIVVIAMSLPITSFCQNENWDLYIANYEKGPGIVSLDLDLYSKAPIDTLDWLLTVDFTIHDCGYDGIPDSLTFNRIYLIEGQLEKQIKEKTSSKLAGTFTYYCHRQNYYYLKDTTDLIKTVTAYFENLESGFTIRLASRKDASWSHYFQVLYPNEEVKEMMYNQRVIDHMIASGLDLTQPVDIYYWFNFQNQQQSKPFIEEVKQNGYEPDTDRSGNYGTGYQVVIYKSDLIEPANIGRQTILLKKLARKYQGSYDGWETLESN